jgi:hypothetical protein
MTAYTDAHDPLTEDEFLARFKPVPNHIDPSRGFDGCMFETFGEELAYVQAQDRKYLWTILDCDGQILIQNGFHFVNRLGYLIATVPTEPGHTYVVGEAIANTIEISWHIDDVKEVRPDLTDAQAREVLDHARDHHDAAIGINWDVLTFHADHLFPPDDP